MWRCLIISIAVFLLSACQETNKQAIYNKHTVPALSVLTTTVVKQAVPRFYSATGYTNIDRIIEISTSQAGTIQTLKVNEGDIIKAGSLLVAIDNSALLASIKTVNATIRQAILSLKDRQHDFNTTQKLVKKKVIPAERLRKAKVQLALSRSQLAQAKSELKRLQVRQPYFQINSPIEARVIKKWVNQGDLAVAGKPLLQLEALDGLEFETALPVKWLDKIHIGDRYKLRLHGSDKSLFVKVSHIVNTANRVTQTCKIKLAIPKDIKIAAGLSGQVDFRIGNKEQVLIPDSVLVKRAGILGVFIIGDENKAYFSPVRTERQWQKQWVVLSGVQAGELLVQSPSIKLRDGAFIKMAIK